MPHHLLRPVCPPGRPCRGPNVCQLWRCLLSPASQGREENWPSPGAWSAPPRCGRGSASSGKRAAHCRGVGNLPCCLFCKEQCPTAPSPQCRAVCAQSSAEHSFRCKQGCLPPAFHPRMGSQQGDGGATLPQTFFKLPALGQGPSNPELEKTFSVGHVPSHRPSHWPSEGLASRGPGRALEGQQARRTSERR